MQAHLFGAGSGPFAFGKVQTQSISRSDRSENGLSQISVEPALRCHRGVYPGENFSERDGMPNQQNSTLSKPLELLRVRSASPVTPKIVLMLVSLMATSRALSGTDACGPLAVRQLPISAAGRRSSRWRPALALPRRRSGGRTRPAHRPSTALLTRIFTATRRFWALPRADALSDSASASAIPVGVSMR